jgi:hypothetical protein
VALKTPKLRKLTFESEIIERYKRRECSVEEAMVEMYLAGVSVRRVEDITEAHWGTRVSASTVSELNQKIYETIDRWRNQPITQKHAYIYLDGIWLKRSWGGEVTNVAVLVAIGVNQDGFREILGGKPPVNPRSPRHPRSAWCGHAPAARFPVPPQLDRHRCATIFRRLAAEWHVHRRVLPAAQGQPRASALLAAGAG